MSAQAGHSRGSIPAGRTVAFRERFAARPRGRAVAARVGAAPRDAGGETRGAPGWGGRGSPGDARRARDGRDGPRSERAPPCAPPGGRAADSAPAGAPHLPPAPARAAESAGGALAHCCAPRTAGPPRAAAALRWVRSVLKRGELRTLRRVPLRPARKVSGRAGLRERGRERGASVAEPPLTWDGAGPCAEPPPGAVPSAACAPRHGRVWPAARPGFARPGRLRAGSAEGLLRGVSEGSPGLFSPSRVQKGRAERCRSRRAEVAGLKGRKQLKLLLSD